MHSLRSALVVLAATFTIACGGSKATPDQPAPPAAAAADDTASAEAEKHGAAEPKKKHAMPDGTKDFHDMLSPLWHADKGAERVSKTCDGVPAMLAEAAAVRDEPTPKNVDDTTAWLEAARQLPKALETLQATCATTERADFAAHFKAVHDAYHVMIDLAH